MPSLPKQLSETEARERQLTPSALHGPDMKWKADKIRSGAVEIGEFRFVGSIPLGLSEVGSQQTYRLGTTSTC